MNIKKISFGIVLLIGIYFGYQQYTNKQNIKVDHTENVKICSDGNCDANGVVCNDSTICCSGNCNAGVCEACYKLGGPCSSDGQCCASNCAYGTCGGDLQGALDDLHTAIDTFHDDIGTPIETNIEDFYEAGGTPTGQFITETGGKDLGELGGE